MVRGIGLRNLLPAATGLFVLADDLGRWTGPVLVVVLLVAVVARVLAWQRHTYELTGDRVVERSGVLSRSERALELGRIQQVDVQRSIIDRVFGTAELRLETAADAGDSEITLKVVTLEEADRLRARLATAVLRGGGGTETATHAAAVDDDHPSTEPPTAETPPQPPADDELLVAVPLTHVALATVTGRRLLLLPAGLAVLVGALDDTGLFRRAGDAAGDLTVRLGLVGLAVLLLVGGVVAIVLTVVAGVLRDGNWTLTATGDSLRVRRGLTTERTATVPSSRVQRVTVDRSWLRGRLGFASLTIHSAGGVGGDNTTDQLDRQLTVPLLPRGEVPPLVDRLLGTTDAERPVLHAHPVAARRRAILRGALGMLPATVGLAAFAVFPPLDQAQLRPVFVVLAVLLPLVGAAAGRQRHQQRASGVSPRLVTAQTGLVGTSTVTTPRHKVQGTSTRASWFQRRRGLATLQVHVAGPSGGVSLIDLDAGQAETLRSELSRTSVHP
jgi:putative membrane protein